jgi:hypothetical protein
VNTIYEVSGFTFFLRGYLQSKEIVGVEKDNTVYNSVLNMEKYENRTNMHHMPL